MKLCMRCVDAVDRATDIKNIYQGEYHHEWRGYELVPESECEFWIHQRYNQLRKDMKAEEEGDEF